MSSITLSKCWGPLLLPSVEQFVVMTDKAHMPKTSLRSVSCYESWLAQGMADFQFPNLDENAASSLCYTSGTTGNPKGVLYSHRSNLLHSYAALMPNAIGLSCQDTVLMVVPQFHANAWGMSYACPMAGAKVVMPGARMDGASIYELLDQERCTVALAVPTVWMMLGEYLKETGRRLPYLDRVVIGGAAVPEQMLRMFEDTYDVRVIHAWGMTEMSPIGTTCLLRPEHQALDHDAQVQRKLKQGMPVFGVDMRIVNDRGEVLPHDGVAFGDLQVKGPWVISDYYDHAEAPSVDAQGWFSTGDVATVDPEGYLHITDRSKDVIKSGGEWISSIDLENIAVGHPKVREAAVIAVPHPKWDERPLLIVVADESDVDSAELLAYMAEHVAKWQVPDDVVFVEQLPHTATGKLSKRHLRETYRQHLQQAVST